MKTAEEFEKLLDRASLNSFDRMEFIKGGRWAFNTLTPTFRPIDPDNLPKGLRLYANFQKNFNPDWFVINAEKLSAQDIDYLKKNYTHYLTLDLDTVKIETK